jgi:hypothetical protein
VGTVGRGDGRGPLGKDLLRELVTAGVDSRELAEAVQSRGIEFVLPAGYLAELKAAGAQESLLKALRDANPVPLTREQLHMLVAGGVASRRIAELVSRRGIAFRPTDEFLVSRSSTPCAVPNRPSVRLRLGPCRMRRYGRTASCSARPIRREST